MPSTATLLEQLIECGTPAHLVAEVGTRLLAADLAASKLEADRAAEQERRDRNAARMRSVRERARTCMHTENPSRARAQEESSLLLDLEVKKEREVSLARYRAPMTDKGIRLPASWEPNEASQVFALDRLGSPAAVHDQLEAFRDYWQAHAGPTARKRDWEAAWRNWCRKARPSKYMLSPKERKMQERFDVFDAMDAFAGRHDTGAGEQAGNSADRVIPIRFR